MPSFSSGSSSYRASTFTPVPILLVASLFASLAASPLGAYENQLRDEARYLGGKVAERGKAAVAVIDFTDLDGAVTHLGRFMAEELAVAMATHARSFRVVDRNHIRSLLKEHKLAGDGLIDPATARELGRIAGVDALITATITPLGDSVRLSIKVLDSETAQVIASSSCNIAKTQAIDTLLRRGVASSAGGGLSAGSSITSVPSSQKIERDGILFELQSCLRSNETVTCHLVITNKAADRKLYFRQRSTRLFDPFGNERYASKVFLGSATSDWGVDRTIVRGVPINSGAIFEGISLETRRLTLVEFGFPGTKVQYKDVPISGS
jgi:TolB-like protein